MVSDPSKLPHLQAAEAGMRMKPKPANLSYLSTQ
jgi:hypothetical protein